MYTISLMGVGCLAIPQLPAKLVEIDRTDQYRSHGNLLPERWEPEDNETVEQHDGDDDADKSAHHPSRAAEETRAADHDAGDHL
jgi:hypothetical protein